ncbi:MAG: tripartite tricarboxylate transporter TctB family protein [Nitrospinae bacterium]|nr:tripartite tricarboxylate transporter TctB family protein [Nitrospinota bacterium]
MGPRNIVGGVVILGFTLYYGGLATLLPKRTTTDAPGPHFFPYLITISILFLSAMLIFQGVRGLKGSNGLADLRPERPSSNENFSIVRAAAGLLLTGLYFFALSLFGFFWSTPVFFGALMWVTGERRPLVLLGLAIAVPMFLFFLFRDLFQLPLPRGSYFG